MISIRTVSTTGGDTCRRCQPASARVRDESYCTARKRQPSPIGHRVRFREDIEIATFSHDGHASRQSTVDHRCSGDTVSSRRCRRRVTRRRRRQPRQHAIAHAPPAFRAARFDLRVRCRALGRDAICRHFTQMCSLDAGTRPYDVALRPLLDRRPPRLRDIISASAHAADDYGRRMMPRHARLTSPAALERRTSRRL